MVIAVLSAIYGAVLTVLGLVSTSEADLEKAGGSNVDLWSGIGMLVLAAVFAAWVLLRPLRVPADPGPVAPPDGPADPDGPGGPRSTPG